MSDKVSISPSKSRRQLRERKQRKLYSDEWALGDDDYEGARGFSVAEKLESPRFAQSGMVREMKGSDLSVGDPDSWLQFIMRIKGISFRKYEKDLQSLYNYYLRDDIQHQYFSYCITHRRYAFLNGLARNV